GLHDLGLAAGGGSGDAAAAAVDGAEGVLAGAQVGRLEGGGAIDQRGGAGRHAVDQEGDRAGRIGRARRQRGDGRGERGGLAGDRRRRQRGLRGGGVDLL